MSSETFKKEIQFDVPEMTKPLYNVVMFSKLFYILDASERSLFDANFFIWMDAGALREENPQKILDWPDAQKINDLDNNKITFFCHHSHVQVDKKKYKEHALSQMRYIQGTSIFVPKKCVNHACKIFENVVEKSINDGYIGSDEKMFDLVYLRNPDNYNLIQCGWREYFNLFTSARDLKVIIAKYDEDISWTSKLNYDYTIYNKKESEKHLYNKNLPNVGRESHTFISYIIDNYDNLPDYVAFIQGNPFDHCESVIEKINNFNFRTEFYPLGNIHRYNMEYESIDSQVISFGKDIDISISFPCYYVQGAQHIISRRLIRKHPIDFYKKIYSLLCLDEYPQSSLDYEKTLLQIYGLYYINQ
jgi:hypothetical protein